MKLRSLPCYMCIFLAAFCSACGNQNNSESTNKDSPATGASNWNMGVALYSFNLFPFAVSLQKADSSGVKYVEGFSFHKMSEEFQDTTMDNLSPYGVGRMKQLMDAKGIKMRSMYVGGADDAQGWKRYFEMGKALGMEFLVCEPDPAHWDILDSLGEIYKIKTAIHEHAKGSSRYWHPDSVLAAIKGHKNIGACADLGHWARSGLDPVKCLNRLKGHILGVHLKDIDELGNPKANDVIVGEGIINFPGVIKELRDQKFKGLIYVECEHKMDNNVPDVITSLKYFNDITKKAE